MKNLFAQHRLVLLPVTLLLVVLIGVQSAAAQVKSFNWEEWQSEITLLENGDLRVVEQHTLDFAGAPFTFGFRTIETGETGRNDGIEEIEVREGDIVYTQSGSNQPRTFEVSRSGGETTINWYFDPALGRHTYTISYIVNSGVTVGTPEQGDGDQIFWTIVPSDHPARVDRTVATINLPPGVQPQQYTGTTDYLVAGYINDIESEQVTVDVINNAETIVYEYDWPLLEGEQFDVRVQFPHGLLEIPTPGWQRQEQIADVISLAVLVVSLLLVVGGPLLVLLLWYLRGRDPQPNIVVPEYVTEPPDNLPPAVVGTLLDEKADMQDVVSTLVDLAHRGYLTMTEEAKTHVFEQTDKPTGDLRPFEQQLVKDVFRGKRQRKLDSLKYKFAEKLPNLRKLLYEELVDEGLVRTSPETTRTGYGCLAVGIFVIAGISFFVLPVLFGGNVSTALCPAFALIVTGLAMLIASRYMPAKTAKGAEATAKWNAFKNYLQNVERYSDLEESTEIFERYFAYAIAFGLERRWIEKFSRVPNTPIPPWYFPRPYFGGGYRGAGAPRPGTFGSGGNMPSRPTLEGMSGSLTGGLAGMSAGLTRMLTSTNTVLKSTPPSSSGGRSSGGFSGGFSGGSSGGGGSAGFG